VVLHLLGWVLIVVRHVPGDYHVAFWVRFSPDPPSECQNIFAGARSSVVGLINLSSRGTAMPFEHSS